MNESQKSRIGALATATARSLASAVQSASDTVLNISLSQGELRLLDEWIAVQRKPKPMVTQKAALEAARKDALKTIILAGLKP